MAARQTIELRGVSPDLEVISSRHWHLAAVPFLLAGLSLGSAWWIVEQAEFPLNVISISPVIFAAAFLWHTIKGLQPIEASVFRDSSGAVVVKIYRPQKKAFEYEEFVEELVNRIRASKTDRV